MLLKLKPRFESPRVRAGPYSASKDPILGAMAGNALTNEKVRACQLLLLFSRLLSFGSMSLRPNLERPSMSASYALYTLGKSLEQQLRLCCRMRRLACSQHVSGSNHVEHEISSFSSTGKIKKRRLITQVSYYYSFFPIKGTCMQPARP